MNFIPEEANKFFQVSVKGLCFNKQGKLLLIQQDDLRWELPGGRLEHGEDLINALVRECKEELGVEVNLLDPRPIFAYSTMDRRGVGRFMIFFRIDITDFNFPKNGECIDHAFYSKHELENLNVVQQLQELKNYL